MRSRYMIATLVVTTSVFALGTFWPATAAAKERKLKDKPSIEATLSSDGALCVSGPIRQNILSSPETRDTRSGNNLAAYELAWSDPTGNQLEGLGYLDTVMVNSLETLQLETISTFPPATVAVSARITPTAVNAWVKTDFSTAVALQQVEGEDPPVRGGGVAYALYIKEDQDGDGIDGELGGPCTDDDVCEYLAYTYNAPWLHFVNFPANSFTTISPHRNDFFQAEDNKELEVQVHVFARHNGNDNPTLVTLSFMTLALSSGQAKYCPTAGPQ